MNKIIYKYTLKLIGIQQIDLPSDYKILSIQLQYENMQMWVLVNSEAPTIPRYFHIYGTGQCIENINVLKYISTVVTCNEALVWHVFEKI